MTTLSDDPIQSADTTVSTLEQVRSITSAKFSPVALQCQCSTIEEWGDIGRRLNQLHSATLWWVGDWLLYGEQAFGELYSQFLEDSGYTESALKTYRWVSSRYSIDDRRPDLSWSHHRLVAVFPTEERAEWLKMAVDNSLSVLDLKSLTNKRRIELSYNRAEEGDVGYALKLKAAQKALIERKPTADLMDKPDTGSLDLKTADLDAAQLNRLEEMQYLSQVRTGSYMLPVETYDMIREYLQTRLGKPWEEGDTEFVLALIDPNPAEYQESDDADTTDQPP